MKASEEKYSITSCGIILLAAGASTRIGRPKQLLTHGGTSLLQHALSVARQAPVHPVILVLGSGSSLIEKEIGDDRNVFKIINENWSEGISSSIRCGLDALKEIAPSTDAAIFMVCDQPFITADILKKLIEIQKQSGKLIVACQYDNTFGTPVLFHKSLFHDLMKLKGDTGAKKLITDHPGSFGVLTFPGGNIDIDTEEDYRSLENIKT